jgi:hypothetical protein
MRSATAAYAKTTIGGERFTAIPTSSHAQRPAACRRDADGHPGPAFPAHSAVDAGQVQPDGQRRRCGRVGGGKQQFSLHVWLPVYTATAQEVGIDQKYSKGWQGPRVLLRDLRGLQD